MVLCHDSWHPYRFRSLQFHRTNRIESKSKLNWFRFDDIISAKSDFFFSFGISSAIFIRTVPSSKWVYKWCLYFNTFQDWLWLTTSFRFIVDKFLFFVFRFSKWHFVGDLPICLISTVFFLRFFFFTHLSCTTIAANRTRMMLFKF